MKHVAKDLFSKYGIAINAVHPGVASTAIYDYHFILKYIREYFFLSPKLAAESSVFCALSPLMEGVTGAYVENSEIVQPSTMSESRKLQKELYDKTRQLLHHWIPPL